MGTLGLGVLGDAGDEVEVLLVNGAVVERGRQLRPAALVLWRGALELGPELQVLCRGALGLRFLGGGGQVEVLTGPMQGGGPWVQLQCRLRLLGEGAPLTGIWGRLEGWGSGSCCCIFAAVAARGWRSSLSMVQ